MKRNVWYEAIKTDVPDEYFNQIKEGYIKEWEAKGYCFLGDNLSDWERDIADYNEKPFRWLTLRFIYIGKRKVKDVALCEKLRSGIKGNMYIIPK